MMATLLTAASVLAALSSDLRVDTDAPDALCPEIGLTRKAVADRLGRVEVEGGAGWRARYTVVHAPDGKRGDVVRLVLSDPTGKVQLERDLPMSDESCATLAQAIALVLERFFRELGQATSTEQDSTEATSRPAPDRARSPEPPKPAPAPQSVPDAPLPKPIPQRPPPVFDWTLGVGREALPAGWVGTFGFGCTVDRWRTRLRLSWPPTSRSELIGPGEVTLTEWMTRLSLQRVFGRGPWDLSLGPELFVGVDSAKPTGLADEHRRQGATLGPGLALGVRYSPLSHFAAGLGFSLDAVLFSRPEYTVSSTRVLELPHWRGSAMLEFTGVSNP